MMKKTILTLMVICAASNVYADLNENGYYRVKNYGSSRWASLVDDNGSVDFVGGTADLHALQLNNNTEMTLSDPASIIYVTNVNGRQYDVAAQGTSLQTLVNHAIYIGANGTAPDGQTLYRIWGTYDNVTKYIMDGNVLTDQQYGDATINDINAPDFKKWYFLPVNVSSDNYFGAVPSVNINGNLYCTLFTSFAYKPYSQGVKAYYIGRVGFGMAEMIEIKDAVPTGSPVVIQCAGEKVSDNKLELVNSETALPSNALTGVYFDFKYNSIENRVSYNPSTMRVLGKCSDGSLGFVTDYSLEYIPKNTAYLLVPAGSAPEFKCVNSSEYEANIPIAPEQLYLDASTPLQPQDDYSYTAYLDLPVISSSNPMSFRFFTSSALNDSDAIGVDISYGKDYALDITKRTNYPFSYGSPYSWVLSNFSGGSFTIVVNLQYQYVQFYSQNAGIESIETSGTDLRYSGNIITSDSSSNITVLNLGGKTMGKSTTGRLDISHLPKGIYIVLSGGKSIKIIR